MKAIDLISSNVATGLAHERLSDVALRISASRSHHCVVLDNAGGTCIGIVRLADIAGRSSPGNRILGDLVGQITPLVVRSAEPAAKVAALFVQHRLGEAIVVDAKDRYAGLITCESVLAWSVKELQLNATKSESLTGPISASPAAALDRLPSGMAENPVSQRLLLVVEDHPESRLALVHILRRRNYGVMESDSVAQALSLAAQHKFDLVISDLELPDGSGFGLMKELRQRYGLKGIAVTGQASEVQRVVGREAGFSYHLKKPVSIHQLEQAIAAILALPSGVDS